MATKTEARSQILNTLEDAQTEIEQGRLKSGLSLLNEAGATLMALTVTPAKARKVTPARKENPRYSASLVQGLSILALFTPGRPIWGVSDVAAALSLSPSTTHRYLTTLVALGQVEHTQDRRYRYREGRDAL